MSHEIRTPLNSIVNFSELENEKQDKHPSINIINKSAKHLLNLVNDILDTSKVNENKLELNISTFAIASVISDIKDFLNCNAQSSKVELNTTIDKDVHEFVTGDERKVFQVLLNLTNNAIKFTQKGSVNINVSMDSQNPEYVIFKVKDTGVGIDNDKLEEIFGKFKQADNSISKKYGGTGLGLTIVKTFTTLMNGKISVQSKLGTGSIFTVKLPLKEANNPTSSTESSNHFDLTKCDLKILVIDDNQMNLLVMEAILKGISSTPVFCDGGHSALSSLEKQSFDIIFIDIHMPAMSGLEFYQEAKTRNLLNDAYTVALTADVFENTKKQINTVGIDSLITKPIPRPKLYQLLEDIQNKKKSASY